MTKITALTALATAQLDDVLPIVDVHDTTMAASGTTKVITAGTLSSATQGLQFLTGGGTLTAAKIAAAQAAGFQGMFLDPRYVWDASGLVINGVQNFTIESRMAGSIGWGGHISYNTSGYIKTDTGAPADGIQVYSSAPATSQTQGVIFRNCVIAGSNSGAVVHFGGGQRRCGLVDTLVYNTNAAAGAYAVVTDTALSDNNGENGIFSFTGGGGLAGAYAALGIGIANQTQSVNDTWYYGLATAGGTYSIVKTAGGNHTFTEHYDRSNPATATVWNHGSGRITFIGGEAQNTTGLSYLNDSTGQITLINQAVTQAGAAATTCQVSAGTLLLRGACTANSAQTWALSGSGTADLSDAAANTSAVTVSGSAGTLMLANIYAPGGAAPVLTSWTGTTQYQGTYTVKAANANTQTTTQTISWTPPAVNVRFRVSVWVRVTVAGTSTVPNLAFTGFSGGTVNVNLPMWKLDGAATAPTYLCAATGDYVTELTSLTDASATAITVTITPTGSTFRYSVTIERIT